MGDYSNELGYLNYKNSVLKAILNYSIDSNYY